MSSLVNWRFVVAASITDKSFMAGLEPFMDVARGDVGALSRWGGQFLVAANAPMSIPNGRNFTSYGSWP